MSQLEGKCAVVTGAARGIGRETVSAFLAEGATVVAADLVSDVLEALSDLDGVTVVAGDLTDPATADRIVAAAGRVDFLNNVAGLLDGMRPVDEVSEDEWARVLAVNLTAPFLLCRRVLPGMVAAGGGVITNVASVAGIRGGRAGAAYTAAKHGLVGLTQNIAITHGAADVRCNAICPGSTRTSVAEGQTMSERGLKVFNAPRFRRAEPSQIASVAVFLASDAASNVNGAILPVDYAQSAL